MKSKHPLDDEFNVTGTKFDDDFDDQVVIPEDADSQNLELVIQLALKQYKMNCDDMSLFEPKNRLKVMEINTALLNTAKDARYKLEMIRMKANSSTGKKPLADGSAAPVQGKTRAELSAEATKLRAVK